MKKSFIFRAFSLLGIRGKKSYHPSHINHIFMYDILVIYLFAIQL